MTALALKTWLACAAGLVLVWLFGRYGTGLWSIPALESWREPSLLGLAAYLFGICLFVSHRAYGRRLTLGLHPAVVPVLIFVVCAVGSRIVLQGFLPSRDEQMAVFDAEILRSGRLYAAIPPAWLPDLAALNREFMLPSGTPRGWVSSYLPGNAAIRALFGALGAEALASPALAAVALAALWSIARTLWPADRQAALVACLVLAGSGQFVLSGMSAYAMTAHLALNLVWLRLLLVRRSWADALAVLVGWAATGLHQPLFHPMFAAPLIAMLALRGEWRRALWFALAYAGIAAFWYVWPQWLAAQIDAAPAQTAAAGASYLVRLRGLVHFDLSSVVLQVYNAVTFVSWQHLLAVPLLVLGLRAARREPLMLALAAGLVLPFVVLTVLLPDQGFGYGYRYVHGALGNLALLAGLGWHRMEAQRRAAAEPLLAWTTAASLIVLLPFQMWSAYSSFRPFAAADRRVTASGADLFVVDTRWGGHMENLVFNRPDLDNRPLRLLAEQIPDPAAFARRHCWAGTIAAFGSDHFYKDGFAPYLPAEATGDQPRMTQLQSSLTAAGCTVRTID
ncbi:MAG: hypothetical protein ACKOQ3_06285 [Novosphingobium sp.]